jgi:hypothetical protein
MANDRGGSGAEALGIVFVGLLGLLALGSLAAPLGGPSQPVKKAKDTPPANPTAQTDWFLQQLHGTRYEESASRTRQLLRQLRQEEE